MESRKRRCSARLFEQKAKLGRVRFLHENCQGTEEDIARMEARLQQCPHLIEYRCKNYNITPLISAVIDSHDVCVEFILKKGADVHAITSVNADISGNVNFEGTALCYATFYDEINDSKLKIASLLLEYGSNPHTILRTHEHTIPLISYLIVTSSIEYVTLCVKYAAHTSSKIDFTTCTINFPYLRHAVKENPEILELLLTNGVGVSDVTSVQELMFAALSKKQLDCLKLLLLYNFEAELQQEYLNSNEMKASLPYIIIKSGLISKENGFKCLEMLQKFGCNLWENHDCLTAGDTVESQQLYTELERLRSRPLTLKELSRVAVLRAMGQRFVQHSDSLELPSTLHAFLKFPDVET